jgi:protease-4
VLNLSGFSTDRAILWELRKALEEFKIFTPHPKKIVVYLSQGNLDLYCLASVADKIVLDASGSLDFLGYAYGRGFAQHTLEKIGIGVRELRYLKYKSAGESFTRDSLSDADKEQYGAYLDDIFAATKALLMEARSWSEEQFNSITNDEFLYSAIRAKEKGLVDYIGRERAIQEAVKDLEGGEPKTWVRWGDPRFSLLVKSPVEESPKNIRPYHSKTGSFLRKKHEIALVYAEGQTDLERGMAARELAATIRELAGRKAVKALVLRVESPGGSAEAADYIAQAVSVAKERIPVVVSMGSVAASGGYWASMNASSIVASPFTLTGSIGVISTWFFNSGLYEKLGLTIDLLGRGAHADLMAGILIPHRDINGEEEEKFRRLILDLYADFVAKVAAGRNMSAEAVEAIAQGRVYSGVKAQEAGLVDHVGGIVEAFKMARELAKIPQGKRVVYSEYPKPRLIDKITARYGLPSPPMSTGFPLLAAVRMPDLHYRLSRNGEVMPILPLGLIP